MKKLLALLTLVLLTLTTRAEEICIDGINYILHFDSQTATLTQGKDFQYNHLSTIEIPHTVTYYGQEFKVTTIGEDAFGLCNLTSVTIPNSVTTIEHSAFSGCHDLTSITIPNSVTTIGDNAFRNCSSLTSITIPNSVTTLGNGIFRECSSLSSITLPNSITTIGTSFFSGCSSLTSITIPKFVTAIEFSAFSGCTSLTTVYCYPQTPPSTSNSAFQESLIANATLYVSQAVIESYKSKMLWNYFGTILPLTQEMEIENIENIELDVEAPEYYDLSGRKHVRSNTGLRIIKGKKEIVR